MGPKGAHHGAAERCVLGQHAGLPGLGPAARAPVGPGALAPGHGADALVAPGAAVLGQGAPSRKHLLLL